MKCCHVQGKPCNRAAQVLVIGGGLVLPMCCWHAAAYRKASPVSTEERPLPSHRRVQPASAEAPKAGP